MTAMLSEVVDALQRANCQPTRNGNDAYTINRDLYLKEQPSIRAALELLSDKEPEAEAQGTLIDVEAERQARK